MPYYTQAGTYTIPSGSWFLVPISRPSLLRIQPAAGTQMPNEAILYNYQSIPTLDAEALRAINGDCQLSVAGSWYVKIGTTTGTTYTARIVDLEGALYGDIGRTGGNRVDIGSAPCTAFAVPGNAPSAIVSANPYRKSILLAVPPASAVGAQIRVGNPSFATTGDGFYIPQGGGILFAGDSLWLGNFYGRGVGGTATVWYTDISN